jgi:hypothetical protein
MKVERVCGAEVQLADGRGTEVQLADGRGAFAADKQLLHGSCAEFKWYMVGSYFFHVWVLFPLQSPE